MDRRLQPDQLWACCSRLGCTWSDDLDAPLCAETCDSELKHLHADGIGPCGVLCRL